MNGFPFTIGFWGFVCSKEKSKLTFKAINFSLQEPKRERHQLPTK
jgi:hypothetical protein